MEGKEQRGKHHLLSLLKQPGVQSLFLVLLAARQLEGKIPQFVLISVTNFVLHNIQLIE